MLNEPYFPQLSPDLAGRRQTARWFLDRAYDLQASGKLEDAVLCYKKSLELHPTAEAYTYLGWTYSLQLRYEAAIEECQKAIAIDPDFGNPYNDIGAYLIELGRETEAISWLTRAIIAKRYSARSFPYVNLGRVYERLGRWTDATSAYSQALRLHPDEPTATKGLNRLTSLAN
jgi:tetratricopeptide (TPR) repeat protein